MAIISKLWNIGKASGDYFRGVIDITLNPSRKAPRTDLHPRMPARAITLGEIFRMAPYRHHFKFAPTYRAMLLSMIIIFSAYELSFLSGPVVQAKIDNVYDIIHHLEAKHFYGKRQMWEDVKYFKEHDPMAKLRPEWFAKEFNARELNYYPKGYTEISGGH